MLSQQFSKKMLKFSTYKIIWDIGYSGGQGAITVHENIDTAVLKVIIYKFCLIVFLNPYLSIKKF